MKVRLKMTVRKSSRNISRKSKATNYYRTLNSEINKVLKSNISKKEIETKIKNLKSQLTGATFLDNKADYENDCKIWEEVGILTGALKKM